MVADLLVHTQLFENGSNLIHDRLGGISTAHKYPPLGGLPTLSISDSVTRGNVTQNPVNLRPIQARSKGDRKWVEVKSKRNLSQFEATCYRQMLYNEQGSPLEDITRMTKNDLERRLPAKFLLGSVTNTSQGHGLETDPMCYVSGLLVKISEIDAEI